MQRMKTALADQQSAISSLLKKELELSAACGKLGYSAHAPEDKYPVCGTAASATAGPVSYGYTNGLGPANGIVHSRTTTATAAATVRQEATSAGSNGPSSVVEDEEQRNDVPALNNQFQVRLRVYSL